MDRYISESALMLISENCPRALAAYLVCHHNANADLHAILNRDIVEGEKSMSWTRFRNDVKSLARQGLLEWHKRGANIEITIAEYDV